MYGVVCDEESGQNKREMQKTIVVDKWKKDAPSLSVQVE